MQFALSLKIAIPRTLALVVLLVGCGGSAGGAASSATAPLSDRNLNLIFVSSEDVAFQTSGDVNPSTANLTNKGLQRSLKMATFLQRRVLGRKNVTGIYTLAPMTHLQTANSYPDLAAPETIQQFALLNHITLSSAPPPQFIPYTGNSYPLNASYAAGAVPSGVATPTVYCPNCQGLDFADQGGDNETLVTGIVTANVPGFSVFSAPWETTSALMANINRLEGYNLTLPASYAGPGYIYAIAIAPSGSASLVTFNLKLNPPITYPKLPGRVPLSAGCTAQSPFPAIEVTGGVDGAVIPPGTNVNETLYIVRHADAHPLAFWSDGNYVCAGQWRALDLPNALRGKISPQQVYSSDPAATSPGTEGFSWSGVAPSLTVEPYAIANGLPFGLAAGFAASSAPSTSDFFFTGGQFSNQTVLLAWSYQFIQPAVNALIASYFPKGGGPTAPAWPGTDYDSIWTLTLDAGGNLMVDNSLCEGIDSAKLPATCPEF